MRISREFPETVPRALPTVCLSTRAMSTVRERMSHSTEAWSSCSAVSAEGLLGVPGFVGSSQDEVFWRTLLTRLRERASWACTR